MWVAKLKAVDEKNPLHIIIKKTGITLYYYPLNHYTKGNSYYFIASGVIAGAEEQKKEFFKEFRKLKKYSKKRRVLNYLETKGDFLTFITSETKSEELKKFIHIYYNPAVIHVKPAVIYPTLEEEQEIACIDRKILEKMISIARKRYKGGLSYLKQEKIADIGILSILPKITEKQKRALHLAIEKGYYEYPRQIELEKLAKFMNISLSTYQAHLRKAERKLLPFIGKKL
ncbi:MAG: helix-turn-helix domain-containing protein [Nanoarchaeota archaeon]